MMQGTKMGYFNELPNLEYLSQLPDANTNETYITVKNLFKRAKLRTDIINIITVYFYWVLTRFYFYFFDCFSRKFIILKSNIAV